MVIPKQTAWFLALFLAGVSLLALPVTSVGQETNEGRTEAESSEAVETEEDPVSRIDIGYINRRHIEARGVLDLAAAKFPGKVNVIFYGRDRELFNRMGRIMQEAAYHDGTAFGTIYHAKDPIRDADGKVIGEKSGMRIIYDGTEINPDEKNYPVLIDLDVFRKELKFAGFMQREDQKENAKAKEK